MTEPMKAEQDTTGKLTDAQIHSITTRHPITQAVINLLMERPHDKYSLDEAIKMTGTDKKPGIYVGGLIKGKLVVMEDGKYTLTPEGRRLEELRKLHNIEPTDKARSIRYPGIKPHNDFSHSRLKVRALPQDEEEPTPIKPDEKRAELDKNIRRNNKVTQRVSQRAIASRSPELHRDATNFGALGPESVTKAILQNPVAYAYISQFILQLRDYNREMKSVYAKLGKAYIEGTIEMYFSPEEMIALRAKHQHIQASELGIQTAITMFAAALNSTITPDQMNNLVPEVLQRIQGSIK